MRQKYNFKIHTLSEGATTSPIVHSRKPQRQSDKYHGVRCAIFRSGPRIPASCVERSMRKRNICLHYLHRNRFCWHGRTVLVVVFYAIAGYAQFHVIFSYRFCRPICFLLFNLAFLARKATKLETKWSKETDKRIRIMNETIVGIRVIKMFGLEHVFEDVIKNVRRFVHRAIQFVPNIFTYRM